MTPGARRLIDDSRVLPSESREDAIQDAYRGEMGDDIDDDDEEEDDEGHEDAVEHDTGGGMRNERALNSLDIEEPSELRVIARHSDVHLEHMQKRIAELKHHGDAGMAMATALNWEMHAADAIAHMNDEVHEMPAYLNAKYLLTVMLGGDVSGVGKRHVALSIHTLALLEATEPRCEWCGPLWLILSIFITICKILLLGSMTTDSIFPRCTSHTHCNEGEFCRFSSLGVHSIRESGFCADCGRVINISAVPDAAIQCATDEPGVCDFIVTNRIRMTLLSVVVLACVWAVMAQMYAPQQFERQPPTTACLVHCRRPLSPACPQVEQRVD